MKVALICPSNMLYMPYVDNYTKIINEIDVEYSIINWDRFKIEKESKFVYRDSKIGHQRRFLDYFKYSRFVLNILKKNNYDKIIVFGTQVVFFLKRYLLREYKNKYIIDIRDHNRIIKYFNIEKVIDNSTFTVLSSPGYKEWLPKSSKYVINHNTKTESLNELREVEPFDLSICNKITVGCIGALRDYKINIDLIEALKNNEFIQLNYHGEGDINTDISKYLIENDIDNVNLTGRYAKEEEEALYYKNSIINVLRYNDSINNKTALPNRLYNASIYGKPMIAYKGTYLSEQIEKCNLGLVLSSFDNIVASIYDYLYEFDKETYNKGRKAFLQNVIRDNEYFYKKLETFILDT
ncbi:hypothetical protein LGK99_11570 [Clostridium algidicarnis]|uniref:hypothetical protein n=1 Tax=Clostridium algidicarnis TaxID=37659 RepID=UPI001CF25CD1|nr:hypothetical protein [Clostridium algidicarnis]MCB2287717.1 hypothetical protein [Clostridium algidicarnis]